MHPDLQILIDLACALPFDVVVALVAAEAVPVEADREPVAAEKPGALIPGDAHHVVVRPEPVRFRPAAGCVAVVDLVAAPVVEEAQRSRGAFVVVLHGEGGHAARDALEGICQRACLGARLCGVEMGDIRVGPHGPFARQLAAQFGVASVLFEVHVRPVAVGPVVGAADDAREAARADAVGQFALQGVVGAVADHPFGSYPLVAHPAGDDVDYAAHGVRSVEHRCRAAQHLHAVGHQRLVGVGDGVSHQTHVLRMTVDEDHQPARTAAQTTHGDGSCCTFRHAVAHDPARGDEQARGLLRDDGQQRGLQTLLDLGPVDDRDRHGQQPDVEGVPGSGNHHFVDLQRAPDGRVRFLDLLGAEGGSREEKRRAGDREKSSHDGRVFMKSSICSRHSSAVVHSRQRISIGHQPVRVRLMM